jgi:hypothetical protein
MVNNVEKMTPEQIISELRRWHMCYRDAPDNFDARLIKRSIQTIENLLDKLDEHGIMYEERKLEIERKNHE